MIFLLITGKALIGVILMVVASMGIGMLWYSPSLFGTQWMALIGMTPEMSPEMKKNAGKAYSIMLIPSLVMAYVLAVFIRNSFAPDLIHTIYVGFFAWLGFVATTGSSEYIFNAKPKPWKLYVINVGYQLANLIVGSIILYYFH